MLQKIESKIMDWELASQKVISWQQNGEQVVFTNGCFDILHFGHAHLLAKARSLGHRLVVGLNSDASVRRLKGEERPVNDEKSRQLLLAALLPVDAVVLFAEDTPLELICVLRPDHLVKGGDWALDQIVGAKEVQSYGGRVHSLPFIEGYSTSRIVDRIKGFK